MVRAGCRPDFGATGREEAGEREDAGRDVEFATLVSFLFGQVSNGFIR
jgi:hypothetical protein